MPEAYEKLKERYAGSSLDVNVCHLGEENGIPYAEFEFVPGRPLSELMDECLDRQNVEGFHNLFAEYLERVGYGEDVPVADFDLIFANILVDGDHWTLIDYEWTFDRPIETRALAFRAVYCYVLEDERRNALELDRILDRLGITENEARQYREQEMEFQKYVTGQKLSMGEIRNLLGGEIYKPTEWIGRFRQTEGELRVQIYEDKGQGFSEENSYYHERTAGSCAGQKDRYHQWKNHKVRRRCGASQRGISHGGSESDDPGGCIGQKGREHPDCENGDRADSPCCGK